MGMVVNLPVKHFAPHGYILSWTENMAVVICIRFTCTRLMRGLIKWWSTKLWV